MTDSVDISSPTKKKKKKRDILGTPQTPPTSFTEPSSPSKGEKSPKKKKESTSKSPKRDKTGKGTEKSPRKKEKTRSKDDSKAPIISPLVIGTDQVLVETVDEDSISTEYVADVTTTKADEMVRPKIVATTNRKMNITSNGIDSSSGNGSRDEKKEENVPPLTEEEKNKILRDAREYLNAEIRLISACKDEEQTSDCSNVMVRFGLRSSLRASLAVGYDGGACTSALLKTLYEHHNNPNTTGAPKWIDLLHLVRAELKENGYKQVPVLTSSRPVSMKHEFNVIPKNYNGNKRALVMGIRYKGKPWELPGCHNDCHNIIKYLKGVHGFKDEDITILMDDGVHTNPTRANILKAFHRFAFNVKAGDAAFFHFSGHGSSKANTSGDEESGFDQTLMPVDVMTNGDILDDEIFRILLVPLPRGLQLTAIVDCCHSGTIFDLPFEFIGDEKYEDGNEMEFRKVTFPHMKMVRAERRRIQALKEGNATESFVERKIVSPIKKEKEPISELKNAPTMEPISEGGPTVKKKKLTPAVVVEDEPPRPKGRTEDNACLIALGCCLLCLNPCKLFN